MNISIPLLDIRTSFIISWNSWTKNVNVSKRCNCISWDSNIYNINAGRIFTETDESKLHHTIKNIPK